MKTKVKSVLLLDDNYATNYLHKKFLEKSDCTESILEFRSGIDALNYLKQPDVLIPDFLFIDINMPVMDAWEFLDYYTELDEKCKTSVVILLSTSLSPSDKEKASVSPIIKQVVLKPLKPDIIEELIQKYA